MLLSTSLAGCGSGGSEQSGASSQLFVASDDALVAAGPVGGPFSPSTKTYEVFNIGQASMDWYAAAAEAWVSVSPVGGTLLPSQSQVVTVSLNNAAAGLAAGTHPCLVTFTNGSASSAGVSRDVFVTAMEPGGTPALLANRTTGVAPLGVVFDAVGVSTGVVQPGGSPPDYGSFTYEWSYGDPVSGTWTHTGRSRNAGIGWIGAHVFDNPGTYRVGLKVTDAQGTAFNYYQDITVTDPDTEFANTTFHVAANGSDSNPGSVSQPYLTFDRGMNALLGANGPARLLLRRGDSFVTSQHAPGNLNGPLLISSYGIGARPQVACASEWGFLHAVAIQNLCIADIDVTMTAANPVAYSAFVNCGPGTTLLRCRISGFGNTLVAERSGCVIADCEVLNSIGYGLYSGVTDDAAATHLAVLGNRFDGAGQHLVRFLMSRVIIGENKFQAVNTHAIKQQGRVWTSPQILTCTVGNVFETVSGWVHTIGPQNTQSPEHCIDTLVEGNLYRPVATTGVAAELLVFCERITIRNNVFDLAGDAQCIGIAQRGIGPVPSRVVIEHNTMYRRAGSPLHTMQAVQSSDSTVVRNNIFHCANGFVNLPTGSVAMSANVTLDPMMIDPANLDYSLAAGSPAIDVATGSATRVDFVRAHRAHGPAADAGALEKTN